MIKDLRLKNEPLPAASSGVSRKRDKFLSNHSSPQQSCEVFWFNNKNHKSSIINHKSIPIQYQKGYVEFYKLKFKVTPDVLIPRPETELLVDEVRSLFRSHLNQGRTSTIIDIGTGAGNVAISIAKNIHPRVFDSEGRALGAQTRRGGFKLPPQVRIIATEISEKALKVAKQNAKLHGVENMITFIKSDLLSYDTLVYHSNSPDIIVTNLPYIPSARIPYLDPSVKDFEPLIALDGGEDGFDLYRKLFSQIRHKMHRKSAGAATIPPRGWKFIGEIDYTHGELAVSEAQKYFPEAEVEVKTDLAHKQRILLIR